MPGLPRSILPYRVRTPCQLVVSSFDKGAAAYIALHSSWHPSFELLAKRSPCPARVGLNLRRKTTQQAQKMQTYGAQ